MKFLSKKSTLPLLIFAALIIGILFGKILSLYPEYQSVPLSIAKWIGDVFLTLLKMIVGPLIFASMVTGVSNIGSSENLGRIGGRTMLLFFSTMFIAIIIGLVLVNVIRPGDGATLLSSASSVNVGDLVNKQQSIGELLKGIVPSNIVESLANNNMLQIIFFAIIFGLFTTRIDASMGSKITDFFNAVFHVMMKITGAIVKLTPIGILGIATVQAAENSDLVKLFSSIGWFIVCVLCGLALQFFVVLPLFLKSAGIPPYKYMKKMSLPLITAFTTASSTAALPLSMEAAENELGISNKISSFVLPLGATVNMNGTALFECVSVIFLSQAYGIELTFYQQVIVVITSLLAAVGCAGIPMAGFVTMTIIMSAVGLPLEGIGVIMSVNFILDMARTSLNVWGDCVVTGIIAKGESEKLNL